MAELTQQEERTALSQANPFVDPDNLTGVPNDMSNRPEAFIDQVLPDRQTAPPQQDEFALPEDEVDEFAIEEEQDTNQALAKRNAAYTAFILPDPEQAYNQVRQEYQEAGKSQTVEQIEQTSKAYQDQIAMQDARQKMIFSRNPEESQEIVESLDEQTQVPGPTVRETALEQVYLAEETISEGEERAHFLSPERLFSILDNSAANEIVRIKNELNPTGDAGGALQQTFDIGRSLLLPGFQVRMGSAASRALTKYGLELSPEDFFLAGDVRLKVQDTIMSLEDPELIRQALTDLATVIRDEISTQFGENNFEVWDYYDSLVGDLGSPEGFGRDLNTVLLNTFGIIDAAGAAFPLIAPATGLLKGTGRAIMKAFGATSRSSVHNNISQVAARLGKRLHENAQESEGVEAALGETVATLDYEHALPKRNGEGPRATYDLSPDYNIETNPVLSTDFTDSFFYNLERQTAQRNVVTEMDARFGGLSDTMHPSKTEVEEFSGGFDAVIRVGHTATRGFPTPRSALAVARRFVESKNENDFFVLTRDDETGELVRYEGDSAARGEFYLEFRRKYFYGDNDTFMSPGMVGMSGSIAKYLDKSSVFDEAFVNASNVAADRSSAILAELVDIRKPFSRLNVDQQNQVLEVLNEQQKFATEHNRWFSTRELRLMLDDNDELVAAALAHKRHSQAMRQLLNRRFYRQLRSEGQQVFRVQNGKYAQGEGDFLGRLREDNPNRDFPAVYDPKSNQMIAMSRDEVARMYDAGQGQIVELRSPVRSGVESSDFMIVREGDSSTRMMGLPNNVIREIPGYIPRMYKANYMVARIRPFGKHNGVRISEADPQARIPLAFAKNRADAEAEIDRIAELEGVNPDELRILVPSEQDTDLRRYMARDSLDYYSDSGQMFTSARGDEIPVLKEGGITGDLELGDFLDVIQTAENRIAKSVSERQMIDIAVNRWEKAFGKHFGVTENGRFPMFGDLQRSQDDTVNKLYYNDAVALRDHIMLLAGVDTTSIRQFQRKIMLSLSDSLYRADRSGLIGRADTRLNLSDRARTAALESSPTDAVKRANFIYHIVANPIRQIVLQSTQASAYVNAPHAARYMLRSTDYSRDYLNLITRLMVPEDSKYREGIIGKLSNGADRAEQDKIYDALKRTGIIQATDSHQYAVQFSGDMLSGINADRAFLRNTDGNLSRAVKFMRRMGFDAGENNQLVAAFLIERNRWIQENPKKASLWDTDRNLATIAGNTRQRSFNMNSSGALAIQRGALSIPFQFMSHTMKAIQVLMPNEAFGPAVGKLSNKFYSDQERLRIALTQSLLWGTGWLGFSNAIEQGAKAAAEATDEPVEIPEEALIVMREGLFGSSINYLAHLTAGGQPPNIETGDVNDEMLTNMIISSNFAPFSGVAGVTPSTSTLPSHPLTKMYQALFLGGDDNLLETLGGAAYQPIETLSRHIDVIGAAAGWNSGIKEDLMTNPVAAVPVIAEEMLRILPAYNKWFQAKGVDKVGKFFNNSGEMTVSATEGEVWLKRLLGARAKREESIADYIYDQTGITQLIREPSDNEVNEIANTMYTRVLAFARRYEDGLIDEDEFIKLASFEHIAIDLATGDNEITRNEIRGRFKEIVYSNLNKSQEAELLNVLSRARQKFGGMHTTASAITEISNMPYFPGQDSIVENLKEMARLYGDG